MKNEITTFENNDLVNLNEGQAVTSSLMVAEKFGKQHKHVMESIKNLMVEDFFIKSKYTNSRGREYPMYYMTKEGFLLLTSSYRGKDALKKKLEILKGTNMIPPSLPKRKEEQFFTKLKRSLKPVGLEVKEQFNVSTYKIDGYIEELNLAIEYDEEHHKYTLEEDAERQRDIEKLLRCKFVRLKEEHDDETNIGIVFKEILNNKGEIEK